jgi:plasmid stabilization system protein ParE
LAQINWTEESLNWLEKIFDYLARDNTQIAEKVVDEIIEKAELLKSFPNMGYYYRNEPEGVIRILLYGHYRIAYFIKKNAVEILGVFHGSMKIENYL